MSDWFTDEFRSGMYYVDKKYGALLLARFCKQFINSTLDDKNDKPAYLLDFAREHVCVYYVLAEAFSELEQFLLTNVTKLSPYWKAWSLFPVTWNQGNLLKAFWDSENCNNFCVSLQREGNTSLLRYPFLLTVNEAREYSNQCVQIKTGVTKGLGKYAWWLCQDKRYPRNYPFVSKSGIIKESGLDGRQSNIAVRPAVYVKMK